MVKKVLTHDAYTDAARVLLAKKKPAWGNPFKLGLNPFKKGWLGTALNKTSYDRKAAENLAGLLAVEAAKRDPTMRAQIETAGMPRLVIAKDGSLIATDEKHVRGINVFPQKIVRGSIKVNKVQAIDSESFKKGKAPFNHRMLEVQQEVGRARGRGVTRVKKHFGIDGEFLVIESPPTVAGGAYVPGRIAQTKIPRKNIKIFKTVRLPTPTPPAPQQVRIVLRANGSTWRFIVGEDYANRIMSWYKKE